MFEAGPAVVPTFRFKVTEAGNCILVASTVPTWDLASLVYFYGMEQPWGCESGLAAPVGQVWSLRREARGRATPGL